MFGRIFGAFLVEQELFTKEQMEDILRIQETAIVKLGLIAVSEKLLTIEQAEEINRKQAVEDKRFGDIAMEMGYLTESQVNRLLRMQKDPYPAWVQTVTDKGMMTLEEVENALGLYQRKMGFTNADIEDFKSGDTNRILSLFIRTKDTFAGELAGLGVRTLLRLIDRNVTIEPAYEVSDVIFENLATQSVEGDHNWLLGMAGEGEHLLAVAETYAGEEFGEMDLFAFDAVCELINCINGMYATALSMRGIVVDLLPPSYYQNALAYADGKVLVVPVHLGDHKIQIIIAMDAKLQFQKGG